MTPLWPVLPTHAAEAGSPLNRRLAPCAYAVQLSALSMFPERLDSPQACDIAKAIVGGFNRHQGAFPFHH